LDDGRRKKRKRGEKRKERKGNVRLIVTLTVQYPTPT